MPTAFKRFWVYVVELDTKALAAKDQGDTHKGAVYVGYTSLNPDERLAKHQAAGDRSGKVFKRMSDPRSSRLRPDLSIYARPYETKHEALRYEKRTHNRLESDGYKVFGDKGRGFMKRA